jgi:catechol 2,3-dioxygenase-like lactoylglutathione lyase family enzyme
MFSHIMLGANDLEVSKNFYDAALGALGIKAGSFSHGRYFYRGPAGVFAITKPLDGEEATHANGGTIGFSAKSIDDVNTFFTSGIAHGGSSCEGEPGYREGVAGTIYIAWLRDPVGNKICAMHRPPQDKTKS